MDQKGQWQRRFGYAFGEQIDFDRERRPFGSRDSAAASQGCYKFKHLSHPHPQPHPNPIHIPPIPHSLCLIFHQLFLFTYIGLSQYHLRPYRKSPRPLVR